MRDNERRRFWNDTRLSPNWYDDSRFFPPTDAVRQAARQALGFAPEDVVAISVSNHAPVKNLASALYALARLRANRQLHLLHVGRPVDLATGDSLPQLAAALGVSDRMHFIGESDDVPRHLHAADLHVMPSLREGMPLAAIEAMATGLPQILADVPGLADFKGLAPGVVHAAPTVDGLAGALTAMAAKPHGERRSLGAAIAEAARGHFSPSEGIGRYIELYDRLRHDA